MTTERNPQGVDGLAEVMGLLGKATPGQWGVMASYPGVVCGREDVAILSDDNEALTSLQSGSHGLARRYSNAAAIAAAVNYLRSHGDAIRELVEAARDYSEHPHDAEGVNIAASRRLRAALAKFPEPHP